MPTCLGGVSSLSSFLATETITDSGSSVGMLSVMTMMLRGLIASNSFFLASHSVRQGFKIAFRRVPVGVPPLGLTALNMR